MGGNAFSNISKIEEFVELDILTSLVYDTLNIDITDKLLGSGQYITKQSFPLGDLDVNMDRDLYDIDHLENILKTQLGSVNVIRNGTTLYTVFEFNWNGIKRWQVDFMFGDFEWQKFAYAGASPGSKYKGVHRTILIKSLFAFHSQDVQFDVQGEMIGRYGPTLLLNDGVYWRSRLKPLKKNGIGRTKAFKEVSLFEYINEFNIHNRKIISRSPITTPQGVYDYFIEQNPSIGLKYEIEYYFTSVEHLQEFIQTAYVYTEQKAIYKIFDAQLKASRLEPLNL